MSYERQIRDAYRELYFWRKTPDANWFTARVFELILKADYSNRARLRKAFPAEVYVVESWEQSPDEAAFLEVIRTQIVEDSQTNE